MRDVHRWQNIGQRWKDDLWELVRYYRSLRGKERDEWLKTLRSTRKMTVESGKPFDVAPEQIKNLSAYLQVAQVALEEAQHALRTEEEALAHCETLGVTAGTTKTKSQEHHQSAKALVATVKSHVQSVMPGVTDSALNPQRRCVWHHAGVLHVSTRNIDGALPSLTNPTVVWEIKEYWGKTKGGSKMSDALYECQLVGRELREFEERTGARIQHLVFLDGQEQWAARTSDLLRFIDLEHQGLIDRLFIGREVEEEWPKWLEEFAG